MNENPKLSEVLSAGKIAAELNEEPCFPYGTDSIDTEQIEPVKMSGTRIVVGIVTLIGIGLIGTLFVQFVLVPFGAWAVKIPLRLP